MLVAGAGGVVALVAGLVVGAATFAPRDEASDGQGSASDSAPTGSASARPLPGSVPAAAAMPTPEPTPTPTPAAAASGQSTADPNSPWVVVNKINPIADAANFVPSLADIPGHIPNPNGHRLHPFTVEALERLADAASEEIGETLIMQSGYRSYSSQQSAFDYWVRDRGSVEEAEKTSARPGYSEHQTGFAADLCGVNSGGCVLDGPEFGDTRAGLWLAENSWRFGFILRYPADKTEVTGYEYEPWHFRFVGEDLARDMHERGITTLEERFGIAGSTSYR